MNKEQRLAELKSRIRQLEGYRRIEADSVSLGVPALDDALGESGFALASIHEVYGDELSTISAAGFIAAVLTLLPQGSTVWIATGDGLYLPGLHPFGIGSDDLLFVSVKNAKDGLWAMEEALRWPGLRAVVAELDRFDLTTTRRLQLAAETSGVTGFILSRHAQGVSSGVTRWQISPAPGPNAGSTSWHVNLTRCRGGRPASCLVEWQGRFVSQCLPSASSQRAMQ